MTLDEINAQRLAETARIVSENLTPPAAPWTDPTGQMEASARALAELAEASRIANDPAYIDGQIAKDRELAEKLAKGAGKNIAPIGGNADRHPGGAGGYPWPASPITVPGGTRGDK